MSHSLREGEPVPSAPRAETPPRSQGPGSLRLGPRTAPRSHAAPATWPGPSGGSPCSCPPTSTPGVPVPPRTRRAAPQTRPVPTRTVPAPLPPAAARSQPAGSPPPPAGGLVNRLTEFMGALAVTPSPSQGSPPRRLRSLQGGRFRPHGLALLSAPAVTPARPPPVPFTEPQPVTEAADLGAGKAARHRHLGAGSPGCAGRPAPRGPRSATGPPRPGGGLLSRHPGVPVSPALRPAAN